MTSKESTKEAAKEIGERIGIDWRATWIWNSSGCGSPSSWSMAPKPFLLT
jgi:hypothetical protein